MPKLQSDNVASLVAPCVFISYSHKDAEWRKQLKRRLLERGLSKSNVDLWDDTRISAGAEWRKEIVKALAKANVAILLVSDNFLQSDFITKDELLPLLEKDGLMVLWMRINSINTSPSKQTAFTQTALEKLKKYQALHDITSPLNLVALPAIASEIANKLMSIPVETYAWQTKPLALFVGRKDELNYVKEFLLDDTKVMLTIVGDPGMGKTALVRHALRQSAMKLSEERIKSIVILSGSERDLPYKLFDGIAQSLSPKQRPLVQLLANDPKPAGIVHQFYRAIGSNRFIVVVDGFDEVIDTSGNHMAEAEYRPFKDLLVQLLQYGHSGIKIIVTARKKPAELVSEQIDLQRPPFKLEKLKDYEIAELFDKLESPVEDRLIPAFSERTGGIPQVIVSVVRYLRESQEYVSLADLLADESIWSENIYEQLYKKELELLSEEMKIVLKVLAVLQRPLSKDQVDYILAPLGIQNAQESLQRLYASSLLLFDPRSKEYSMSRIERTFVSDLTDVGSPDDKLEDRSNLGPKAVTKFALLRRALSRQGAIRDLQDLTPHISVYNLLCNRGEMEQAWRVLEPLYQDLSTWGYYATASFIELAERLYEQISHGSQFIASLLIGNAYFSIGRFQTAKKYYGRGIQIGIDVDDADPKINMPNMLIGLGNCFSEEGNYERALQLYQQAVDIIPKEAGDSAVEHQSATPLQTAYLNLALCFVNMGRWIDAEESLNKVSDDQAEEHGVHAHKSSIEGELEMVRDNVIAAVRHFEKAISGLSDDMYYKNPLRARLAMAQLMMDNITDAERELQNGFRDGYPSNQHKFLLLSGVISMMKGDREGAEEAWSSTVRICDESINYCDQTPDILYTKDLALCGLIVCGKLEYVVQARSTFLDALSLTSVPGIVIMSERNALFTLLCKYDPENHLKAIKIDQSPTVKGAI